MILKTVHALAVSRPQWQFELLFSETNVPWSAVFENFGIKPPLNLTLGTIFPAEFTIKHQDMGGILRGEVRQHHESMAQAGEEYWRARLAEGPAMIYTRNMAIVEFFRRIGPPELPLVLELHQLKYRIKVEKLMSGLGLSQVKALLAGVRNSELETMAQASHVFCISRSMLHRFARGQVRSHAGLLPSAAEVKSAALDPAAPRPIDLLYTGQLYHWKGVHTLIEALCHLPAHLRLTVVGGNNRFDLNALQTLARNLGVADRIDWRGQLPHHQVLDLQQHAKLGLVPLPFMYPIARWYTSPIKIYEMMAAGTPLLVSSVPALRDVLTQGETAWFARPDDPRDWARQIERLLADEPLRRTLAEGARNQIVRLSFAARAETILATADALLAGRTPALNSSNGEAPCSPAVK